MHIVYMCVGTLTILDTSIKLLRFTNKWDVYRKSHLETIWLNCPIGSIIPYTDAKELKAI
jgi:hypothetical protein